jgi:hypothetical protein
MRRRTATDARQREWMTRWTLGGLFNLLTIARMVAGLRERLVDTRRAASLR